MSFPLQNAPNLLLTIQDPLPLAMTTGRSCVVKTCFKSLIVINKVALDVGNVSTQHEYASTMTRSIQPLTTGPAWSMCIRVHGLEVICYGCATAFDRHM